MAFRVAARTILELGAELISSDATALYELIKNAYDARSKRATIAITTVFKYSHLRDTLRRIEQAQKTVATQGADAAVLADRILQDVLSKIDESAPEHVRQEFIARVSQQSGLLSLAESLKAAFDDLNTIAVIDTGRGMTLKLLDEVFLTIGTRSRLDPSDDGRAFVGGKGLGRLSTMRLGDHLTVETSTRGERHWNVLQIDWRAFTHESAVSLDKVTVQPRQGDLKTDATVSGTTLRINALKADWDWDRVKRLTDNYFDRLFDPFHGYVRYPLVIEVNGRRIPIPTFAREVFAAAFARGSIRYDIDPVEGPSLTFDIEYLSYDRRKTEFWSREDILGVTSKDDVSVAAMESLGPFKADFHWFNRQKIKGIDGVGDRNKIRDTVNQWANGLMMYRDGFRVNPYGNPDDDWLGIDSRALSSSGYKVNRKQLIGAVYISATENPHLIDQTNREGLRTNEEKTLLVLLLRKALTENFKDFLNSVEAEARKKAHVDVQEVSNFLHSAAKKVSDDLSTLRAVVPAEKRGDVDCLQEAFQDMETRLKNSRDALVSAERQHRDLVDLAGVGLQVEIIAHELGRVTRQTLDTIAGVDRAHIPKSVAAAFDAVESQMRIMRKRLEALDPLGPNSRNRAEKFDVRGLARDIFASHSDRFARLEIEPELDLGDAGSQAYEVRAVRGMIVQVLENLIDNSIFWLRQQKRLDPTFVPKISLQIDAAASELRLTDNGPGIPRERAEEVFRPFVTFKPPNEGKGLGLYISREIAKRHAGDLYLLDNPDARGRLHTFVLSISGQ